MTMKLWLGRILFVFQENHFPKTTVGPSICEFGVALFCQEELTGMLSDRADFCSFYCYFVRKVLQSF